MKRYSLWLGGLLLALVLITPQVRSALAEFLASDTEGTINAPATEGSAAVDWEGNVPSGGTGGTSDVCIDSASSGVGNAWFYKLTIAGTGDPYYDTHAATLDVRIDWDPTGGVITSQDLALYIRNSGGTELASSDGGSNSEFLQLANPAPGDYTIVVCAFAAILPQDFIGQASLNVELVSGSEPLPSAEVDHGFQYSPIIIVDPQRDVAEPSLRVDGNGIVYACGPFGASRAAEYAQRSTDDGDTFRVLGLPPEGRIGAGGGGDCELSVGTELNENGHYTLAYTGLEALVNFSNSTSRDGGESFFGGATAVTFAGVDRQWMEGVGTDTVYLGYNAVAAGYQIVRSDDGGQNYSPDPPVTAVSDLFRPGPIRIDADPTHNPEADNEIVYFTFTRADSVWIARSYDRGLTWTEHEVANGFNPNNIFSSIAIDTAGNLYATWTEKGTFNTYYAFSLRPTDNSAGAGDVWSEKRLVNRDPIYSTAMPWIEAGDPGNITISYYGSPFDGNIEVGTFDGYWHVYVAASFNALDGLNANDSVPFSQAQVTTHPVHWDSICLSGLGCSLSTPAGDRTLLDFFQNRIDKHGRVHVVYNQSNKIPGEELGRIALVSYSKQTGGPSLFDNGTIPVDSRGIKRSQMSDVEGDSKFPISTFSLAEETVVPPPTNEVAALDILDISLSVVEGGELGEFEIALTMKDLSAGALNSALTSMQSGSLIYAVRFFSGTEAQAAVATYNTAGWQFGFNDLVFSDANGTKLEAYTGETTALTGEVNGNVIRMKVRPSLIEALDLPSVTGAYVDPTPRVATVDDVLYSMTAFTFGNANANSDMQEYLNQADSTYPFDYTITAVPTAIQLSGQGQTVSTASDAPTATTLPVLTILGVLLLTLTICASLYMTWQRKR